MLALLAGGPAVGVAADGPPPPFQAVVLAGADFAPPDPPRFAPAPALRLDRARIEASGATTLPELLAREAGLDLLDPVGNDRGDLLISRGAPGRRALRVSWNGARIDSRDLHTIPLEALEAVEIRLDGVPWGDHSDGGVIVLIPRRSSGLPALDATLRGGARGDSGAVLTAGLRLAGWDAAATVVRDAGGGFRDGGRWSERRGVARVGRGFGAHEFAVDAAWSDDDHPLPGPLSRAEQAALGRTAVPWNGPDRGRTRAFHAAAGLQGATGPLAYRVTLRYGRRAGDALITGRPAAEPSGFGLWRAERADDAGASAALRWMAGPAWTLDGGAAWSREAFALDARTRDRAGAPLTRAGAPDDRASDLSGIRRTLAARLRGGWRPNARFALEAAVRADRLESEWRDAVLPCTAADAPGARCRSRLAGAGWSLGARFAPRDELALYADASGGFAAPDFEQPAAAPGREGHPELAAATGRALALGVLAGTPRAGGELRFHETRQRDEIRRLPPGRLDSAGGSRVRALEGSAWWRPHARCELRGALTRLSARFLPGALAADPAGLSLPAVMIGGNRVPLAPRTRYAAEFRYIPIPHAALNLAWRARSRSLLDGDETNRRAAAGGLVPASHRWDAGARWDGARVAVDLRLDNLTGGRDESYGRTDGTLDEFTPVPPASVRLAITVKLP